MTTPLLQLDVKQSCSVYYITDENNYDHLPGWTLLGQIYNQCNRLGSSLSILLLKRVGYSHENFNVRLKLQVLLFLQGKVTLFEINCN